MYHTIVNSILKKNIRIGHLTILHDKKKYTYGNINDPLHGVIEVKNPNFFRRVVKYGEVGLGESYVSEEWNSPSIMDTMLLICLNFKYLVPSTQKIFSLSALRAFIEKILFSYKPLSASKLDSKIGMSISYDVSNDFFLKMLGEYRLYSCAIFRDKKNTLEEAQQHKLNIILKKLNISPEHKVIDIGCGWGTVLKEIHEKYHCNTRGISLSKEQIQFCLDNYPFSQFDYMDYRDITEKDYYDRVVSIGMLEHVGYENLQTYIDKIAKILKPNGRAVLHTMIKGGLYNVDRTGSSQPTTFANKYIVPVGYIPQCYEITNAVLNSNKFRIIHQEKFGIHYGETIKRWRENVLQHADEISKTHSKEIIRLYDYAWAMVGSWFASGCLDLFQIVIEKNPAGWNAAIYDTRANDS